MTMQARVQQLERQLRDVWQKLRGIPSRFAGGGAVETGFVLNNIAGGSVLGGSISGIKYDGAFDVTEVPDEDPTVPDILTFPVGLGRANLLGGGIVYVALRPDPGAGVVTGLISDVPNLSLCLSKVKVSLPLDSDPLILVDVYIPFRF